MRSFMVGMALLGLARSAPSPEEPNTASKVSDNIEWSHETASAIDQFTTRFYSKYVEQKGPDANLVFSPFSIHLALAMLTAAATPDKPTQLELFDVMGGINNIKELENSYKSLLDEYKNGGLLDKSLEFGNAVWVANGEDIKATYRKESGSVFYTDVEKLTDVEAVNKWVRERTHGKIDKLFEQLSPEIKFLLTNVVYFHDAWVGGSFDRLEEEFDPVPDFKLSNGGMSKPNWMQRSSQHFVLRNITIPSAGRELNFKAVSIPYEHDGGNRFDMVLLVPSDDQTNLPKLEYHLSKTAEGTERGNTFIDAINNEFKKEFANEFEKKWGRPDVTLTMPMFSIKGSSDVAEILKKLEVNGIFNSGEFGQISDKPLKVGNILHKATIDVNTEGTEAAAATGIELVPLSAFINTAELQVDKPFLFIIRDKVKEVPLFVGKVMDPTRQN